MGHFGEWKGVSAINNCEGTGVKTETVWENEFNFLGPYL